MPQTCRRCEGVAGSASEIAEARAAGLPLRAVAHLRRAQGETLAAGTDPNLGPAAPSATGAPAQPAAAPSAKSGTEVAFGSAAKAAPTGKGGAKGAAKQPAAAAATAAAVAVDPAVLMAGAAETTPATASRARACLRELCSPTWVACLAVHILILLRHVRNASML